VGWWPARLGRSPSTVAREIARKAGSVSGMARSGSASSADAASMLQLVGVGCVNAFMQLAGTREPGR
jgi:hypothetical protein